MRIEMTNKKTTKRKDRKVILSTLWIVVMFNMLFADILSFMVPGSLKEIMTGTATEFQITQGLLLIFAILLEIPIAMIFLSRVLKYRANRWVNIIASVITIAFVTGMGTTDLHYIFFATIEVVSMLLIIWYAWKLPKQDV
jgi:Sec-independent protein secretion pathway component TatC